MAGATEAFVRLRGKIPSTPIIFFLKPLDIRTLFCANLGVNLYVTI